MKYKAVVIGLGKIGAEEWNYKNSIKPVTHAAAYFLHPKITLVGLCDIDSKKLHSIKKFFPGVMVYDSAKKMLQETKPDIVSVATHPDSHYKFVKMAAAFGAKAVVCEKPMADSIHEAESMIKICKEKHCLLFVNHSRHFDKVLGTWQKKIQHGFLGRVLQVTCLYHNGLSNNGTHTIDFLRWFLGDVQRVSGFYNVVTSNPNKDKNVDAMIFFKNGSRANLQSVTEKRGLTEWVFYGEIGEVAFKKLGMEIQYRNVKVGGPRSLMAQMVSHITSCLEKKERPKSTGEDGLAVLKTLFAIKKSADNNGKINVIS